MPCIPLHKTVSHREQVFSISIVPSEDPEEGSFYLLACIVGKRHEKGRTYRLSPCGDEADPMFRTSDATMFFEETDGEGSLAAVHPEIA